MKKLILLIFPLFSLSQATVQEALKDIELGLLLAETGEVVVSGPFVSAFGGTVKTTTEIEKFELVNDTLHIYQNRTHWDDPNTTCAVYNCQVDHSPTVKERVVFVVKDGKLVQLEVQHPKYIRKEKTVYETIETW